MTSTKPSKKADKADKADKTGKKKSGNTYVLPVLPLKDTVLFPHFVKNFHVGRESSINAIDFTIRNNQKIFLLAQKKPTEEFKAKDLYKFGTIATILRTTRLPNGKFQVLIEGEKRGLLKKIAQKGKAENFISVECEEVDDTDLDSKKLDISLRSLLSDFESYLDLSPKVPVEAMNILGSIEDPSNLADTIGEYLDLKLEQRQKILEESSVLARVSLLLEMISGEIEVLKSKLITDSNL